MMSVFVISKNSKKWYLFAFGILILISFFIARSFFNNSGPIGGWEQIETVIEAKFANNENLKNAALQLALAHQKAIDNPAESRTIVEEHQIALSCLGAVLSAQKFERSKRHKIRAAIEAISTSDYLRQIRYIKYNANLSGGVYSLVDDDIKNCSFKLSEK